MPILKSGSTGPAVATLQDHLRKLGFDPGVTDGGFGPATQAAVMLFQRSRSLLPDGIVGPRTIAAIEAAVAAAATCAGFDTSAYPGDPKMSVWKARSPYAFVAYYLKSPCHRSASWMGHRTALLGMGWQLLPVYVGQQMAGVSPCTRTKLTAAQGQADGREAASSMLSEGFPGGTFVYLDIERSDAFPAGLAEYITAWISTIAAAAFGPGIYCHKHNAADVRTAVLAALPGSSVQPRFWIVGGVTSQFDLKTSRPGGVGVSFADIWQCPVSVDRTFGGVTIHIDEDVSRLADPAGPVSI